MDTARARRMVLCGEGSAQLEVKKSRFLSFVYPVSSEEDVVNHLAEIRKKYWDARHHCYAYVIGKDARIQRCSDDGEPSQTAGKPILDVVLSKGLTNILVIVTRYFGGTLLGTGGLIRAYTQAAQLGIAEAPVGIQISMRTLQVDIAYPVWGRMEYFLKQEGNCRYETEYLECVRVKIFIPQDCYQLVYPQIVDLLGSTEEIVELEPVTFIDKEGAV